MQGRDFKAAVNRVIGDDDAVIIGDHQGQLHDVKVIPFAGISKKPGQKVLIVIPNFNRPQAPQGGVLLPKTDWWPEAPLKWEEVRAVCLRFRDDTSADTTVEFIRQFSSRHALDAARLVDLGKYPEFWSLFVQDVRARYQP